MRGTVKGEREGSDRCFERVLGDGQRCERVCWRGY